MNDYLNPKRYRWTNSRELKVGDVYTHSQRYLNSDDINHLWRVKEITEDRVVVTNVGNISGKGWDGFDNEVLVYIEDSYVCQGCGDKIVKEVDYLCLECR